MILPDDFRTRLGIDGKLIVPPYPIRKGPLGGPRNMMRIFADNILGIFLEADFSRPIHRLRVLARPIVVCNTPETVQEAFSQQHDAFQRKTPQMRHALAPLLGDGLFVSDGEIWKARRAAVAPIIHGRRVGTFAPVMAETARDWLAQWQGRGPGAEIDALAEMGELTAEIIARTVFGRRLGREFTAAIVSGFVAYQRTVDQVDALSMAGAPDWVPRRQSRAARAALAQVHGVIDDILDRFAAQRKAGAADEAAVIGQLFDARDAQGRPWPREAIRNEAIVIFMAGHETTANTLAWAWYLLSRCARSRGKLEAELDRVLGARPPDLADVEALVFTRAVIEETLRLYPPVPVLGREAIAAGIIAGEAVTRGTLVLVVPWLLHRNSTVWTKRHAFMPERFDPALAPRPSKHAYVPFATGPRICPGLTFGLTEAVLCLATLAQGFRLDLVEGAQVMPRCRLTLRPGDTLPMRLIPRAAWQSAA